MVSGSSTSAAESSDADRATAQRETRNREKHTTVDAEMASVWRGKSTVRDRKRKQAGEQAQDEKTGRPSIDVFTRDVVLLPSADCELVPSHARRAKLLAGGFVLNLFRIDVGWDEETLTDEIRKGVSAKLRPLGEDIEFFNIDAVALRRISFSV